mgnify:CR=1 FL=1
MVVFLLPIFALAIHNFLEHEHAVCSSKIENHIHEKDVNCELHLVKQTNAFLFNNSFSLKKDNFVTKEIRNDYYFLKNHPKLSFSLRGPPVFI